MSRISGDAGRILKPVAQIGVADEGTRVAQPPVHISGHRQLMVPEEIAEYERGASRERAVARRVSNRRIGDVIRVECHVVRVLLEPGCVRQPEHWIGLESCDIWRQIRHRFLQRQHRRLTRPRGSRAPRR